MGKPPRDPLPDVIADLEPGGYADEFVRASAAASIALVKILQGDVGLTDPLSDRLDRLEQQLDTLNENVRNFVKVLSSLPTSDE